MAEAASSVMRNDRRKDMPWLPPEVIECVLSFLPVPVLCRFRTVCKGWNDLLCGPSFHDLYEKNGKEHREVCFLTRFKVAADGYSKIDLPVKGTTCFLDLDERRWYSIKGSKDLGYDTRAVAMDEGLVAEFWCEDEKTTEEGRPPIVGCVKMSDPISKITWTLKPPFYICPPDNELPRLVVAADRLSRSFRVFLLNNAPPYPDFLYIHDSSKSKNDSQNSKRNQRNYDEWQCVVQIPNPEWKTQMFLGFRARSAVFFRGDLYAIISPFFSDVFSLVKYDCQNDTWSMIREVLPEFPAHPQLLLSSNRLFMRFFHLGAANPGTSNTISKRGGQALEIDEIQIPENALRIVFQIPSDRLERFFDEWIDDLACVIPRVGSDGSCTSVALVSEWSGRVIIYNVVSGAADILPVHPLGEAQLNQSIHRRHPRMRYWAAHKNLSFRDILRKEDWSVHPFVSLH